MHVGCKIWILISSRKIAYFCCFMGFRTSKTQNILFSSMDLISKFDASRVPKLDIKSIEKNSMFCGFDVRNPMKPQNMLFFSMDLISKLGTLHGSNLDINSIGKNSMFLCFRVFWECCLWWQNSKSISITLMQHVSMLF